MVEKLQTAAPSPTINVVSTAQDGPAAALARRIEQAIRRNSSGRIHKLRVEIDRGEILLRGFCSTFYVKQLAQHAAMSLAEGHTLQNQIEVW